MNQRVLMVIMEEHKTYLERVALPWACIVVGLLAVSGTLAQDAAAHSNGRRLFAGANSMLRDGFIEEGDALLRALNHSACDDPLLLLETFGKTAYRQGVVKQAIDPMLAEANYAGALRTLLYTGYWSDAAFVAERIMTLEELVFFVEEHATTVSARAVDMAGMHTLLARRLARAGHWSDAASFHQNTPSDDPEHASSQLTASALTIADHLKNAMDTSQPKKVRAQNYFAAGKTVFADGSRLMRPLLPTERFRGYVLVYPAETGPLEADDALQTRISESAPTPGGRLYHTHVAAALMKRCAMLLPDNHVLTAEALYLGGIYLHGHDPDAADWFYKALVRRNPNFLIAQQADELRWFPNEFTDEEAYAPLPERPYKWRRGPGVRVLRRAMEFALQFVS